MRAAAFALLLLPAAASDVGKRYPSERRAIADHRTGATLTAITTSPAGDDKIYQTHAQWTAGGRHIIFRSDRAGGHSQAFAYSEETGEIIQLTDGAGTQTGTLNVSRRSDLLWFFRGRRLIELRLDPLLADSRSGSMKAPEAYERIVTTLPEGIEESGGLSIDSDEKRAYLGVRVGSEGAAIRAIDLAGGALTAVIDVPFRVGHVQANPWIPGEILYCHETGGDAPQRMWLVNADGSGNRPLYRETPEEWITHEVWANRDHVIFNIMGHTPEVRAKPHGIAVINVRNGSVRILGQTEDRGFWHSAATDDLRLAVGDTFTGELHVVRIATGERWLLTAGHRPQESTTHTHHSISPDGRRLLFNSAMLGNSDLMIAPLEQPDPSRRLSQHRVSSNRSPAAEPGAESVPIPSLVDGLRTADDWLKKRRPELMALWMRILGKTEPAPADRQWFGDIRQARILNTQDKDTYTRIHLELPIEKDFYQPHLLLIPRNQGPGPFPAVICWTSSTPDWIAPEQWWGAWLASRGYVVLTGWSFIRNYRDGTTFRTGAGEKLYDRFGRWLPMGKMVHDAKRQAEFLRSRADVDGRRIGFIGFSLGAKAAVYVAAFAPEIAATVALDPHIAVNGGTNWYAPWYLDWTREWPGLGTVLALLNPDLARPGFEHDHHELMALTAPRPFLLIGGSRTEDRGGDSDDMQSWGYYNRAREVYELLGVPERIAFAATGDGHKANGPAIDAAWQAFFERWLKPR